LKPRFIPADMPISAPSKGQKNSIDICEPSSFTLAALNPDSDQRTPTSGR
jgi:hypothetical protein